MSALSSQFSLSLELTNLIPLSLVVAGKTYEAAMRFARDLQNSGSDIVIEEDLAEAFGRARIEDSMVSSFKTVVSRNYDLEQCCGDIHLMQGPGPTVLRAFTESAYFSTIVQCSFLVSFLDKDDLAMAISRYFEKISRDSPEGTSRRSSPRRGDIRNVLQAIQDQTEMFPWTSYLLAIARTLDLEDNTITEPIPICVFHGLIPMLPITQTLPEDRYIVIGTHSGVCGLVAWTHLLLGLPVLVRLYDGGKYSEYRFPSELSSQEQVLIEVGAPAEGQRLRQGPSITLLSATTQEELFKLKTEADDEFIDGTHKTQAKGFACRILERTVPRRIGRERVIQEMAIVTCSFSMCIAEHIFVQQPTGFGGLSDFDENPSDDENESAIDNAHRLNILHDRLFEACLLLFETTEQKLQRRLVDDYVSLYQERAFSDIAEPPRSIGAILKTWNSEEDQRRTSVVLPTWSTLRKQGIELSLIILAFAHVTNLECCEQLPLSQAVAAELCARSELGRAALSWDGSSPLSMKGGIWLQILALLMIGHTSASLDFNRLCLLSDQGWSLFVNTFGDADPIHLRPGLVTIKRGVPWRNGTWCHKILDGPQINWEFTNYDRTRQAGGVVTLSCSDRVLRGKPLVGERDDCFLVTVRFFSGEASRASHTGYKEMWLAACRFRTASSCPHPVAMGENLKLEPGWTANAEQRRLESYEQLGDLNVYLTSGNSAARWRALIEASRIQPGSVLILLRESGCCLECSMDEASKAEGRAMLIL